MNGTRLPMVTVVGLIGSGKSTLTEELGVALGPNTLILREPVIENGGNPYLADYYAEPKRWSLTMQVHLLALRFRMHKHAQWHSLQGHGASVIDGSYYMDTAFARLQLKLGLMEPREFDTYSAIYHAMTASVLYPTACVRVLVDPTTCNRRISRRMERIEGRKCESAIDLNYLQNLDGEIEHMVSVLKHNGVTHFDMPWDLDRDNPEARQQAVQGLAARILATRPPDPFLDLHRRTM